MGYAFAAFSFVANLFTSSKGGPPLSVGWQNPSAGSPTSNYQSLGRAYTGNEIVFAGVNMLSTSAGEPHIIGKRLRRNRPQIRAYTQQLKAMGIVNRAGTMAVDALLVSNQFVEEVPNHPLVTILNNPNPMSTRPWFFAQLVMDRKLAGNAYILKGRGELLGNTAELWRLRPDRVRIIPNAANNAVEWFEYAVGRDAIRFPAADVIHLKEAPSPFDEWSGISPLMAALGRIDIDRYQRDYLRKFYESGGTGPGSILTIKSELDPEARKEISERFKRTFGGPSGWHEMLVLDNTESTYNQMGLDRGLRDALPKELDAISEARIAMVLGIPGSIIGLLIAYASGNSYANKRADWQVFWDITMTPMLSDIADALNKYLTPEFEGIDEVCFDLSDIRALQEDEDALQDRARENFKAAGWSLGEFRAATGLNPKPEPGELFFVPAHTVPTEYEKLGVEFTLPPNPDVPTTESTAAAISDYFRVSASQTLQLEGPRRGRPGLSEDSAARAIFERGERLRREHPTMTNEQIASRVGVSDRTWRRYRGAFE